MSQLGQYNYLNAVIEFINGNVGGPVAGLAGTINLVGTGGVTVTGAPLAHTLTISIPAILTATGDVGGAVSPTVGGNLNIVGGGTVTVTGNPATNTLTVSSPLAVRTVTGNAGGAVDPAAGGNLNIVGGGVITATGTPGTNTVTITYTGGTALIWAEDAGPAVALVVDHGYIVNNVALVTATLPAAAALGTVIRIAGKGTGLYTIAQRAGQVIHFDDQDTTIGVVGSLTATNRYDSIELLCTVADTDWTVLSSVGNFTVV